MVLIVVIFLKIVPIFVHLHIITAEVTVFCGPWSNPGRASACLSFLWIPWTWSPHLDSAWLSYTSLHSAHSFRSSLVFCGRYPPRILRARSLEGNLALSWSFLDPSYATDYMANSNFFAIVLGCSPNMLQVLRTLSFILSCERPTRSTLGGLHFVAAPWPCSFAITNGGHGVREQA